MCLAAHVGKNRGGLPKTSNSYCHPGKAGGTLTLLEPYRFRWNRNPAPSLCFERDLIRKPISTLRDRALVSIDALAALARCVSTRSARGEETSALDQSPLRAAVGTLPGRVRRENAPTGSRARSGGRKNVRQASSTAPGEGFALSRSRPRPKISPCTSTWQLLARDSLLNAFFPAFTTSSTVAQFAEAGSAASSRAAGGTG